MKPVPRDAVPPAPPPGEPLRIHAPQAGRRQGLRGLLALPLLLALPGARAAAPEAGGGAEAATLSIEGEVRQPLRLTVAALRDWAEAEQVESRWVREVDGRSQATVVRGVRLRAVLAAAGLAERDLLEARRAVVLLDARDGYRAVFAWQELFNTEGGAHVLLAHSRDGQPLGAHEGPFAAHAPADVRHGPRHVKWLQRVQVRVLRD